MINMQRDAGGGVTDTTTSIPLVVISVQLGQGRQYNYNGVAPVISRLGFDVCLDHSLASLHGGTEVLQNLIAEFNPVWVNPLRRH
ncbi:hypothetical protein DIJ64_14165 [Mycobacterium leprae]|uniref:Uncharacterized protein n=1 Tax=Mycobacterium leprae TaxID=1769 RepID=A0AAD0KU36_MYCLR|nr:hypothetical protein DIJ64_14165 [Mycobacterium leprae]